MSKINVLPKNVAELIAAGEVIERPASIVKELVENSIDAGATQITIEIKNGGITYIRVSDNGCGIEKQDLKKAFLRHATSKVLKVEDLNKIFTLGFRGEALASICAVSNCTLISKTIDSDNGYFIKATGGIIEDEEVTGCQTGTVFIAEDLFFNTPARMKFLKKDSSEGNAVGTFIEKLALSHPKISFKFIKDEKIVLNTPGNGDLFSTIYAVYGKDFANSLMKTEYEMDGIKVHGYINKPDKPRGNRIMENFFINNRFFRSKTVMAALEEGYKNAIMVGKFPSCVLFIDIAPELCDCNVHPQKLEVRFANEKPIFHSVYYAVKQAVEGYKASKNVNLEFINKKNEKQWNLNQNEEFKISEKDIKQKKFEENSSKEINSTMLKYIENVKNQFSFEEKKEYPSKEINNIINHENINYVQEKPPVVFNNWKVDISFEEPTIENTILEKNKKVESLNFDDIKIIAPNTLKEEINTQEKIKIIGEAFKTYIIVQKNDEIILIDKHAAHERIIFETLKKNDKLESQTLLTPIIIKLSSEEYDAIFENLKELEEKSFDIENFGENTIIVRKFPNIIKQSEIEKVVFEIAGNLVNNKFNKNYSKLDWIYHSIACRAAIKANDITATEEIENLAKKVFDCENINFCPHGRPVKISITKKDIEKMFGRIQ
ncbi:MAG: DNA mismatch repair endonuclease MutL [Clostridia bacterium]